MDACGDHLRGQDVMSVTKAQLACLAPIIELLINK